MFTYYNLCFSEAVFDTFVADCTFIRVFASSHTFLAAEIKFSDTFLACLRLRVLKFFNKELLELFNKELLESFPEF